MRLWTWQSPELSPYEDEYDSISNSRYINNPFASLSEQQSFINAYKKLWKMLGNKGIIWCYADKNQAVKAGQSYPDCVLWELDVPESSLRYLCNVTWHYILRDIMCVPPERFKGLGLAIHPNELSRSLQKSWLEKKKKGHLWEILLVDRYWGDCVDPIVFHPLGKGFYKGNV